MIKLTIRRLPLFLLLLFVLQTAFAAQISNRKPSSKEIGYLPADGETVTVNPPALGWLNEKGATSWAVQIAQDSDFKSPVVSVEDWPYLLYTHTSPLPPGRHYWRYKFVSEDGESSNWSQVRSFDVPSTVTRFPRPSADHLREVIPTAHPRMFIRPENLDALRQTTETSSTALKNLLSAANSYLKPALMTEPKPWTGGKWNVEEWREYNAQVRSATARMKTLAFAWLLTGRDDYGARAKEHLLHFSTWDPAGPSSMKVNDEVGMPLLYSMSRTYDWIYPLLSEQDRDQVREAMRARGEETYHRIRRTPYDQFVFNSHFGRMWHFLGEAAISFYGEIPEAEKWLNYAMTIFYGWYPYWGDADGGWSEGIAYWTSYNVRITWWLDLMQMTLGIDGSRKPFFANVADYPMYVSPPGVPTPGFGDFSERPTGFRSVQRVVGNFAALRQNSAWQWYAELDGGVKPGSRPLDYLHSLRQTPPAKAPVEDAILKVFQKSGTAVINTALTDPENNIYLAMRCSEFGNVSHSHNDQNAIVMSAYGEPLLVNTGRRDYYNSPFCKQWYWHTRSHNSLLIDGKGQHRGQGTEGRILAHGETPDQLAWVVGDATKAYGDLAKLYRRWTAFVPGYGAVVVDELETTASEISLLYHGRSPFHVKHDSDGPAFRLERGDVSLHGKLLTGNDSRTTQTDKYPVPLHKGIEPLFDEWHLTVHVPTPDAAKPNSEILRAGERIYLVSLLQITKGDAQPQQNARADWQDGKLRVQVSQDGAGSFALLIDPEGMNVVRAPADQKEPI